MRTLVLAALALASCSRLLARPRRPAGHVGSGWSPPRPRRRRLPRPSRSPRRRRRSATPGEWTEPRCRGGTLAQRFAPPAGFVRVALAPRSFGAWLRGLPLEPDGTPVRSYRGGVILPPDHANLAAVVALDVGDADLQQCADSVIRLHAEWLFAQGRRDASYRAASGAAMPFARWAQGERMVPEGVAFKWAPTGRPDAGHAAYRRWLDGVFMFANTGSLARDTEPVDVADLRPGDFVVQPGAPGHAVLVLDMARAPDGRRALLLGQGYMPAQSFHVLRPGGGARQGGAWFVVEPGDPALETPFWAPFPWKALHRFAGG